MAAGVCVFMMLFCVQAFGAESVRDELIRQHRDTGLTFVWIDRSGIAKAIDFGTARDVTGKNISGSVFAPADFDFSVLGNYQTDYCWSHDRLNVFGVQATADTHALLIVNRRTKKVSTVVGNLPSLPHVAPQCWSRDDRQVVYELDGHIGIFDIESGTSHPLVSGIQPSWSPDGDWISFLYHGSYYAIRPDGKGRKRLFHKGGAKSPLYWSPDSRIVAYAKQLGMFETKIIDDEVYGLRVRRLSDGDDERLGSYGDDAYAILNLHYVWITKADLVNASVAPSAAARLTNQELRNRMTERRLIELKKNAERP
jgi:hypothetical protein